MSCRATSRSCAGSLRASGRSPSNTLALSLGHQVLTRTPRGHVLELADLLSARARVWLASGQWGAARGDLARAIALLEGLPAGGEGAAPRQAVQTAMGGYRGLMAEVELGSGDREGAMRQVRLALEQSPVPEIVADLLKAAPALEPLHSHPDWAALVEAGR